MNALPFLVTYGVSSAFQWALTSGTKLGPYEMQSPLDEGGIGEVYRAHDTRLDLAVALKILHSEVAGDPERRATNGCVR